MSEIKVNEKIIAIVDALRAIGKPVTLNELNELVGFKVAIGTLRTAINNGFVKVSDEKGISPSINKRPVNVYEFVTDEVGKTGKGKEKTYSESEKEILAAFKNAGKPMTLAEVSEVLGRKLVAGSVSGITGAGNIRVIGKVMNVTEYTNKVNKYEVGEARYEDFVDGTDVVTAPVADAE